LYLQGEKEKSCLIKEERENRGWARCNRLWEAEGAEKRRRGEESWEERKNSKEVELRNEE